VLEALKLLNVSRIMDVSWETRAVFVVKVNIRTDGRWAGTVLDTFTHYTDRALHCMYMYILCMVSKVMVENNQAVLTCI